MPPASGRDRDDAELRGMLARFGDGTGQAWTEFLDRYAARILQIIRVLERREDDVSDAFLWVCERLADRHGRRLRQFDPDGPARFDTWLSVVVHNLCRDWRRAVSGRRRLQAIIARLPAFDRAVFTAITDRGLTIDRALVAIRASFPSATAAAVDQSHDRVTRRLTEAARPRGLELALVLDDPDCRIDPVAGEPDPEAALLDREGRHAIQRVVRALPNADRVLVALRYRHGLTLAEVARATGLADAQTADRRLRAVLAKIRTALAKR